MIHTANTKRRTCTVRLPILIMEFWHVSDDIGSERR
jgi:hypothetical protein